MSGFLARYLAPRASLSLRVASVRQPSVLIPRWYSNGSGAPKYDNKYYDGLVKDKKLVVFMKGDPSAPMCGFSRLVVQILHMHGVDQYEHHNVLEDVEFKEGMKQYSNWPTFPQVYMNGELVGGADIMLQMHQSGDLIEELKNIDHQSLLLDKSPSE
ncbi:uncharacterized monothiol glutaredoxin ycf64-like [Dysidea avara]|uniref:uncharacterized monothiol glutaredoxin ycf64-like n=1 Tax=Dysidea avara TaxID=196820 RepID=UPI0033233176